MSGFLVSVRGTCHRSTTTIVRNGSENTVPSFCVRVSKASSSLTLSSSVLIIWLDYSRNG